MWLLSAQVGLLQDRCSASAVKTAGKDRRPPVS